MRLINRHPGRAARLVLGSLPFLAIVLVYLAASATRLADNPGDKLLPALSSFARAIETMAFTPDRRTGAYLLWSDTWASLGRLWAGLGISAVLTLIAGLAIGVLPMVRALLAPVIAFVSMVPPLALLPILFIALGLGETSKIVLIVIGVTPFLIRDLSLTVASLPREMIIKAETLSASTWLIALRVVLPQAMPRLIDGLRLQLGPAFLFLIAAEAISADAGLGYRIFLVRRYLSMDIIFPYVAWITLLAVAMDLGLGGLRRLIFPWWGMEGRR
ncbi:NitT/TauT family transport system permease protein [Rhodovulum bhavnagarense]|uniref:NitT/TauT family transport system permease protein n=1 Tax=Rhodovulum bhavnagarense TaxID=992286 RepID=A0A4R2REC4_9RHOB|nr:ABC transporter permease subunit [Rhodovulum bhavnagarense]TCP60894.1 NitT/TauT family transport system permease protein [Rhodovulum bhavnagarense]